PGQITERVLSLVRALEGELLSAGFEFLSPKEGRNRSGILTFRHPKVASNRLFEALRRNDVVASLRFDRQGQGWIRVSPHFYNTMGEIAKVADALQQAATAGVTK